MSHTTAVAHKFALYLHKNKYLKEYSIEKNEARKIYYETFRKELKTRLNFGTVFFHTLSLLKKGGDLQIMVYKVNRLQTLQNKEVEIDAGFNLKKVKSPTKIISHRLSFSNQEKMTNAVFSEKECKLCGVHFEKLEEHLSTEEHKFFEAVTKSIPETKKQSDLQFTIDDSPNLTNIILRTNLIKTFELKIQNKTKFPIKIAKIQTNSKIQEVQFDNNCPCDFPPFTIINFKLTVLNKTDGVLYYPILFTTQINQNTKQYAIELFFHTHSDFFDDLHPSEPYKKTSKPVITDFIEEVDIGEPPNLIPSSKVKVPLPKYKLPIDVATALNVGLKELDWMPASVKDCLNHMKTVLPPQKGNYCLTPQNYTKLLDLLLFIEEHQIMKDIREYDLEDQTIKKDGHFFELEVPGLAEHRPSVIVSDAVNLRDSKQGTVLYVGYVHKVKESSVLLKFSQKFSNSVYLKGKKFYVNFSYNRYNLRVEHQAVALAKLANIPHLLFPQKIKNTPIVPTPLNWFDKDIADNIQQQQAVRAVLNKTAMPSPYLIFGPPGTGKTMTIVEAVKQIHKLTKENILICAPSNNAANEVTRRLVTSIPTTDLFRFIAHSFPYFLIPDSIKKYINYPNKQYYLPPIEEFMKYRIVVTTLTSAARLVNGGLPFKHFGYVFIDEAGQATETESLIAIAGILTDKPNSGVFRGQIVLAGDPKQLGPIIHSTLAKDYGFGTSMLERLMDTCGPYKKNGQYNPNALTKLVKNYRSHGSIIKTSNELFYDKELQVCGDHLINVAIDWECLPNRKFPMIFHSVFGADQREKTSPSFFNVQEVQIVISYLEKLVGSRLQGMSINPEHVGIITPYKKQVEKIRKACEKKNYGDKLMIGTVEQFQGQEKLIVILSTVRSKPEMLTFDKKFHLGFLDNPKRFNVAVTRAKALLIVVGNPNLLQLDNCWRSLIGYCKENNAVMGHRFEFSANVIEETLNNLQNLSLLDKEPGESASFSRGIH